MIGADQITLKLRRAHTHIEHVEVLSNRTTMTAQIMEGKHPEEACNLLPLLFSLCGTAQLQAGLKAFEQAMGYDISPAHQTARQILLDVEGISEHITRCLVDWPNLAKLESDVGIVRDLRNLLSSFKDLIFVNGKDKIGGGELFFDTATLHNHVHVLIQKIDTSVFEQSHTDFLAFSGDDFSNWLRISKTSPAQCLKKWQEAKIYNGTWDTPNTLPSIDKEYLTKKMDGEDANTFIAQPVYKGQTCETGPFSRQLHHNLIKAMVEKHGFGSLSRLTAKLIDLAQMLQNLKQHINTLDQESALFHTRALHEGLGEIEAVRGRLSHRVILDPENDNIKRYRILAPTEWNFHPNGPLKTALLGCDATDPEAIKQSAHVAVMALDPCVACDIVIEDK